MEFLVLPTHRVYYRQFFRIVLSQACLNANKLVAIIGVAKIFCGSATSERPAFAF